MKINRLYVCGYDKNKSAMGDLISDCTALGDDLIFLVMRLGSKTALEDMITMIVDLKSGKVVWENKSMPDLQLLHFSLDKKLLYSISRGDHRANPKKPGHISFYKAVE